jgi:hypothetical protein
VDFNVILDRVQRAVTLKEGVYAEIGSDQAATGQAIVVAAVAGLISSVTGAGGFFGRIIGGLIGGVIGLAIFTGVIFLIGRLFKGQGQYVELFRGLGYASAPSALGLIPFLGWIGGIWSVVLAIRAVKEINKVSDGAAAVTVLIPVVVIGFLVFILVVLAGIAMLGFAAAT